MKVKKTVKTVRPTLPDRLKQQAGGEAQPVVAKGGKAAVFAFIAGFLALATSGVLAYVIWKHWEFLRFA